jgi:hypothetical protein
VSDVLVIISELPKLEILEVLEFRDPGFELVDFDAAALSGLPSLRLVDLEGSKLWVDTSFAEAAGSDGLPLQVAQHLMCLQRARPGIEWVLGNNW